MAFIALEKSLDVIRRLRPIVPELRKHDAYLADQIQRAATSIPLNLAEGRGRTGNDRRRFWRIAAGSCEELRCALRVATAWAYLSPHDVAETQGRLEELGAILWSLRR